MPANTKEDRADVRQDPSAALSVRLMLCAGTVWAISAMELVVFTFTRERMEEDIDMGTVALELLGAATPIGSLIGGPLFGIVADVRGRRTALLLSMTLALLSLALSAGARVDNEVLLTRVAAGVGLSGEVPAAIALVYELAPNGRRASAVALLHAFAAVGAALGVLLAHFVAPVLGWRVLYLAMSALLLFVAVVRVGLPESPLWLANVGRVDEALTVVTKLDRSSISRSSCNGEFHAVLIDDNAPSTAENSRTRSWAASSTPDYCEFETPSATTTDPSAPIVSLLVLFLLWTTLNVCDFALGSYLPTLISLTGFNVYASWYTCTLLYLAPLLGSVIASVMLDRHQEHRHVLSFASVDDRKFTLALFVAAAVVFAVTLSYLPWSGPVVTTGASLVSISLSGVWSVVLAYTPEHFCVSKRARGVGVAVAFGGGGGVLGALVVFPRVYDVWTLSVPTLVWTFGGGLIAIAAVLVPLFGVRRASVGSCE